MKDLLFDLYDFVNADSVETIQDKGRCEPPYRIRMRRIRRNDPGGLVLEQEALPVYRNRAAVPIKVRSRWVKRLADNNRDNLYREIIIRHNKVANRHGWKRILFQGQLFNPEKD